MGFSLASYAAIRPSLWHLTNRANLHSIRESRMLMPAEQLGFATGIHPRRGLPTNNSGPVLRDQDLLHASCIAFESGFSMTDLLKELNKRVFFWSGWPNRPIKAGRHAMRRYADSDAVIRISFLDLASTYTPYFSRCNSGATRMQHGKPVQRGTNTFLPAEQCNFSPSHVVEVTFVQALKLPPNSAVLRYPEGHWEAL